MNNTDQELEEKLLNDKTFQHILKLAPKSQRDLMTFEIAKYFTDFIPLEEHNRKVSEAKAEVGNHILHDIMPSSNEVDDYSTDEMIDVFNEIQTYVWMLDAHFENIDRIYNDRFIRLLKGLRDKKAYHRCRDGWFEYIPLDDIDTAISNLEGSK